MLAAVERFAVDAEERNNQYFQQLLSKQHTRLKSIFDRHVVSIITELDQFKVMAFLNADWSIERHRADKINQ